MTDDLRPVHPVTGVPKDTPLVDDLAEVLARTVVGWEKIIGYDLALHPEVVRVMVRYRAWKVAQHE